MNCLFNGIELPALPERDTSIHKKAYICYTKGMGIVKSHYTLVFTSEPYYGYSNIGEYCIGYRAGDVNYYVYEPITAESSWGTTGNIFENPDVFTALENVKWANFPVYNEDGTLYLSASEPVPVSPVQINPALLVQSFFTGQAIRRMRGKPVETPDEPVQPEPTLPEKGNALADYSWSEISEISKAGAAPEYFAVGDEKDITLTTDETITLRIIGFNHDILSDGSGYAGITFEMKNMLAVKYIGFSGATNAGGWSDSSYRERLQPGGAIYDTLSDEVKGVIVPVDKISSVGSQSTSLDTTSNYAFLLSEVEVRGREVYSAAGEGTWYDYYSRNDTNTKRIKKLSNGSGSALMWLLRSPAVSSNKTFCGIGTDGLSSSGPSTGTYFGISFAFCV